MARTKVRLNSPGVREVLRAPGLRAELLRRAEMVASEARATAPVASGAYRDSISVTDDVTDRVVARVVASAPHSHLVEARTGNLSRALDAAGG